MAYRKMITGANWKIYKRSVSEVKDFAGTLKRKLPDYRTDLLDAYILPDPVSLKILADELGDYPIDYGTQDVFWEDSGPYTGEISPLILKDIGAKYVFIGHSERKKYFGETDTTINKKIHACYRNGLIPLVLIGETKKERDEGSTEEVLKKQLFIGLRDIPGKFLSELALIYEPVWAIGQKEAASLAIIEESHKLVRKIISEIYSPLTSGGVRLLYGGSVNVKNGSKILEIPDVDGLAITRAALDPANFIEFVRMTEREAEKRFKQE